ncbi:hypothetical protein EOM39_00015 [Candidatus Gracilibacteria bacterium]|nr:hypothetical protein [Candidatus Gracilibacteria bacterium]
MDVVTTTGSYTAYITGDNPITGTGIKLQILKQSISHKGVGFGAPSECPEGFIRVPGNPEFNQPGFCVMKYEATYEDATVPNLAIACAGGACNSANYLIGKVPVSKPLLYPVGNLRQSEAIDACKSIGEGYHLITNNEWMTIARNIESQGGNWTGNSVGNGSIFRGLGGDESNTSISPGCKGSDSQGFYSSGFRIAAPLNQDTTKWGSNKGSDCDSKRQHILSNGEIIWDISGNMWDYVNGGNSLDGLNNTVNGSICTVNSRLEYTTCIFVSPYSYSNQGPKTLNLNTSNGIGVVSGNGTAGSIFIRGSSDNNDTVLGTRNGIYTLFARSPIQAHPIVGFRCAK